MLEHFLVYFDRLHKRIFNHMALKQSLVFSPVETIIFWTLVFLLKMFTIEWHFVLFVDLTDFVFCTLYYTLRLCTDKKKWLYDKRNTIVYFPTFNCVFCIWI